MNLVLMSSFYRGYAGVYYRYYLSAGALIALTKTTVRLEYFFLFTREVTLDIILRLAAKLDLFL